MEGSMQSTDIKKLSISHLILIIQNDKEEDWKNEDFLRLVKGLIRYCYGMGSTTAVKFEIYNIIRLVSHKLDFSDYYAELQPTSFNHLWSLKKGFALLTYLVRHPNIQGSEFACDKLFRARDVDYMLQYWPKAETDEINGNIANYFIRRKTDAGWTVDESKVVYYLSVRSEIEYYDFMDYSMELKMVS